MEISRLEYYLILINVIGFILSGVHARIYSHYAGGQIYQTVTVVIALIGGSAGSLLAILLFDKKPVKQNMMSRVVILCVFVIQVILLLMFNGHHAENLTFSFWNFFKRHKFLRIYWIVINLVTFVIFFIDKWEAKHNGYRIPIVTLLGFSFIGGAVGGLIAMYVCRHKINKDYFTVGLPMFIVIHIVVVFYTMNAGW